MADHRSADGPRARRGRTAILATAAGGALLLGVLVYLTDRSSASAVLIPRLEALAGRHVFGAVGLWLPSFVHPLAFSLLTAAALPPRAAPRYGACVFWGALNIAFEAGQHAAVKEPLAGALYAALGRTPPVHWVADYFLRGTFDIGDLVAALLGAGAAAAVLYLAQTPREQTHAP